MANTSGTVHDDFDEAAPEQVVLIELSASIVVAYVSRNAVPAADMPSLIGTVHSALLDLRKPIVPKVETKQAPAVPVKRSIQDEQLICLECGKSQISLKRHLGVAHSLVPSEYRAKWGLRPDYPMVAPGYSARRSELAKQLGFGRQPKVAAASADSPADDTKSSSPKATRKRAASTEKASKT